MKKTVAESRTEQVFIVRADHLNGYNRLFGGQLMMWIDELAGVVARRHTGLNVTTATVDNLSFKAPAYVNDLVVLVGKVTYVGTTSLEVGVEAHVEHADGSRKDINKAHLVMVAIDDKGKPIPVPGLELVTEEDRAEWEDAQTRFMLRRERRIAGI